MSARVKYDWVLENIETLFFDSNFLILWQMKIMSMITVVTYNENNAHEYAALPSGSSGAAVKLTDA